MIVIFAALGYGAGKTAQVMKAGGDLVSQASSTWILVAVIIAAALIARFIIRRKLTKR